MQASLGEGEACWQLPQSQTQYQGCLRAAIEKEKKESVNIIHHYPPQQTLSWDLAEENRDKNNVVFQTPDILHDRVYKGGLTCVEKVIASVNTQHDDMLLCSDLKIYRTSTI